MFPICCCVMRAGWPQSIPWASEIPSPPEAQIQDSESSAQQPFVPPHIPKFACDVMVEGLARQLRLCGVDAVCPDAVPKRQRHLVHRHGRRFVVRPLSMSVEPGVIQSASDSAEMYLSKAVIAGLVASTNLCFIVLHILEP